MGRVKHKIQDLERTEAKMESSTERTGSGRRPNLLLVILNHSCVYEDPTIREGLLLECRGVCTGCVFATSDLSSLVAGSCLPGGQDLQYGSCEEGEETDYCSSEDD